MLKIKKVRKQQKWQIFDTEEKKVIKEFDSLAKAKEFIKTKKTITKKTEQLIKEQKQPKAPKVRVGRGGGGGRGGYGGIRYQQIDEALLKRKFMELQQQFQSESKETQQREFEKAHKNHLKTQGYTDQEVERILKAGQDASKGVPENERSSARIRAEQKVRQDIFFDSVVSNLPGSLPPNVIEEAALVARNRVKNIQNVDDASYRFQNELINGIRKAQGFEPIRIPPLSEENKQYFKEGLNAYGTYLYRDYTPFLDPEFKYEGPEFDSQEARQTVIKNKYSKMFPQIENMKKVNDIVNVIEPLRQIEDEVPMVDPDEQIQALTNVEDKRSQNDAGNNDIVDQPRLRKTLNKTGTRLMDRLIKAFEKYNIDPIERQGALSIAEQEYEARGAVGLQEHVAEVIRRFRIENEEAVKELQSSGAEIPEEEVSGTKKRKKVEEQQVPVISEPDMQLRQQIQSDNVEPQQFSVQEPPPFVSEDAFAFPQFVGPNVPAPVPAPIRQRKKKKQTPSVEQPVGPLLSESEQQFLSNQAMAREEQVTRQQQNLQQILENPNLLSNANLVGLPRSFENYKSRRLEKEGEQQFEYYEPKGPKEERRRKQPSVYDPSSETSVVPFGQVGPSFENQSFGESLQESRSAFD